jgi:ATP-dependent DNA helicase RecG
MPGKKRIFISSVQKEFATERRALRDYLQGDPLLSRFFEVFLFEDIPAADRRADEIYLAEVDRCSVYVGMFGNDYGFEDTAGVSPTEHEFDRASAAGKLRLIFVKGADDAARNPKMLALLRRAGDQLIRRRFGGVAELTAALYASLVGYLEQTGLLRTAPFDAAACAGSSLADLTTDKLDEFLTRARSIRGYALGPGTPMATALAHLNLLDGGTPNHAAILLFGQETQRWLPTSAIKCLHFHGTEVRKPIPSHQVYRGTVFALVDQAVDFVMSKIDRTVGTRAEGNAVPVSYELPREAVAEAIVNAVAHRDYTSNASVQVMLFADRLEIWNPGELPAALSPERLTRPHASIPHNPLLAEPLFLAGYIEQAGTGTLDMIALSREAGLKAPGFRQDGGSFVQTLWRPIPQATGQATTQATTQDKVLWASAFKELIARATQVTGQATGQATGQVAAALQAYFAEPKTTKEIQDSLGLSHRETFLDNYLTPMLEAGLLERTIPDKPTSPNQRYRLTAKGRTWLEGAKP